MIYVSATTTAAELQDIIDSAPAGTTVQLGAGTFEFDRTVVINRDDIAVVGQGSDTTTINLVGNARAGGAFQIGGVIDQETYSGSFDLTSTATEGSTTLHLADTTGLKAGDVLWVELPNTPEYLDSIGDTQWREDKPLRTSMVEVASVDGNTVTLVNGLAFDFTENATVQRIEVADNVRVGGFTIDFGPGRCRPGPVPEYRRGLRPRQRDLRLRRRQYAAVRRGHPQRAIERRDRLPIDPARGVQHHRRWLDQQGRWRQRLWHPAQGGVRQQPRRT